MYTRVIHHPWEVPGYATPVRGTWVCHTRERYPGYTPPRERYPGYTPPEEERRRDIPPEEERRWDIPPRYTTRVYTTVIHHPPGYTSHTVHPCYRARSLSRAERRGSGLKEGETRGWEGRVRVKIVIPVNVGMGSARGCSPLCA